MQAPAADCHYSNCTEQKIQGSFSSSVAKSIIKKNQRVRN